MSETSSNESFGEAAASQSTDSRSEPRIADLTVRELKELIAGAHLPGQLVWKRKPDNKENGGAELSPPLTPMYPGSEGTTLPIDKLIHELKERMDTIIEQLRNPPDRG